jgi:hypothetical protein
MRPIVDRSPFFQQPTHVNVGEQAVLVRPFQIVLWVSVEAGGRLSRRIPAILDTGFSLNFAIQQEQLRTWAGLSPGDFRVIGRSRISQQHLRLYGANIALHANVSGKRDEFRDVEPGRVALREGIVIYPSGSPLGPRLPLLGLRALAQNHLVTVIDGQRCELTIRRKRWLFPFA